MDEQSEKQIEVIRKMADGHESTMGRRMAGIQREREIGKGM